MVADAVNTRKPVGIVPIAKSGSGEVVDGARRPASAWQAPATRATCASSGQSLRGHGFGGTIDAPLASDPPDFTAEIAERVRRLLELPPVPAKAGRDSAR